MFLDLTTPWDFRSKSISIRRLKKKKEYRFEHDGLPCVFIHGAGVKTDKDELLDRFDSYWGRGSRLNMPPYCSRVKFVKMDMLGTGPALRLSKLLRKVRYSNEITKMILITHGSGGSLLAKALRVGHIKQDRTMRWLGLNVPHKTPHVFKVLQEGCDADFRTLLNRMARRTSSKLKMHCVEKTWKSWKQLVTSDIYKYELSAGLCGAVASHRKREQEKFIKYFEKTKDKSPLKRLTDGINRLDSCLVLSNTGNVLSKLRVLATSYWDSQMIKGDRINSGGVRHWLHVTATKALEKLVNGKNPDLKGAVDSELERLYEEAEIKRARRDRKRQN